MRNTCPLPAHPTQDVISAADEAREKAIAHNLACITGERGWQVVVEYSNGLPDFESDVWMGVSLPFEYKFSCCMLIIPLLVDDWGRLHFDLVMQPRNCLFATAMVTAYNHHESHAVVAPIAEQGRRCDRCVDKVPTHIWLPRLLSPHDGLARKAHMCMRGLAAASAVISANVERKHLFGQALRHVKADAFQLARRSRRIPSTRACRHDGKRPSTMWRIVYCQSWPIGRYVRK